MVKSKSMVSLPPKRKQQSSGRIERWLPAGFPDVTQIRMHFVQFGSNTLTSGSFANLYSANSIFQPSQTIDTTHQPYYHDQYSGQYEFYEVIKSQIKVTFSNSTVTDSVRCVLSWTGQAAFSSNSNSLSEIDEAKHCLIGPSAGTSISPTMTHTYSIQKYGGSPGSQYSRTPAGTTPNDPFFWVVQGTGAAGGATGNIATNVEITYWVRWSTPISIAGS